VQSTRKASAGQQQSSESRGRRSYWLWDKKKNQEKNLIIAFAASSLISLCRGTCVEVLSVDFRKYHDLPYVLQK